MSTRNINIQYDAQKLAEMMDSMVTSLWIGPIEESKYNIAEDLQMLPKFGEWDKVNEKMRHFKTILAFLHSQLDERAEAIKFQWEEDLAFSRTRVWTDTPTLTETSSISSPVGSISNRSSLSEPETKVLKKSKSIRNLSGTRSLIPRPSMANLHRSTNSRSSSNSSFSFEEQTARPQTPNYQHATISSLSRMNLDGSKKLRHRTSSNNLPTISNKTVSNLQEVNLNCRMSRPKGLKKMQSSANLTSPISFNNPSSTSTPIKSLRKMKSTATLTSSLNGSTRQIYDYSTPPVPAIDYNLYHDAF